MFLKFVFGNIIQDILLGVWTKRGVGHGVGHGLSYGPLSGLPVVSFFFKTRLRIALNLFKQCAPIICHIYDTSVLMVAFCSNFLRPVSNVEIYMCRI